MTPQGATGTAGEPLAVRVKKPSQSVRIITILMRAKNIANAAKLSRSFRLTRDPKGVS